MRIQDSFRLRVQWQRVVGCRRVALARLGLLCAALVLAPAVGAWDWKHGDLEASLRGFGNLTAARTTDGSAEFMRNLSQLHGVTDRWSLMPDSLLGLQANVRFDPRLELVVQGVSRDGYDGTYRPELTWAFARFTPSPALALRAGRLGTEFYMLSDSRSVGYSYLTVRPPTDYFATLVFNSFDGFDAAFTQPVGGGLLTAKVFSGLSRELIPLGRDPDFDLNGSLLVGGYLDYFKGNWQIRLGHSGVRYAGDLPLERLYGMLPKVTADELRVKDHWSMFSSLGIVYDKGPAQIQLMLSRTLNDQGTFQDTWAGYAMFDYRIRDWTPFIGVSFASSKPKRLSLPISGVTDAYQRDFHSEQHTLLVGTRWDFYRNLCLKAEVDVIRGSADSKFLYRWETAAWDGSMTVFGLSLDFVF